MERVIKFRAWDSEINQYRSQGTIQLACDGSPFSLSPAKGHGFIIERLSNIVIQQFTGLFDKNGKEAYVGCIYKETLLNGEERFYKIFEVEGGFAINTFQDDFYKPSNQIQFWTALSDMQTISWFKSNLEEIGNTYENPELLSTDKTKTVE